jgi:HEAT repeat protein
MTSTRIRRIMERSWLRVGMAVALLVLGSAAVGAPILSDNAHRQASVVTPARTGTPGYVYQYVNQPDGTAQIQRATGGFRNWATLSSMPEAVVQLVMVHAASGQGGQNVLYARSVDNIWRSNDSGTNWAKTSSLPSRPLSMAVGYDTPGLLLAGSAQNGLFTSVDGGANWLPAGGSLSLSGPGALAVPAVALNPADEQVVYATAELTLPTPEGTKRTASTSISPDGGRTWFEMQTTGAQPETTAPGGAQLLPDTNRPLAVTLNMGTTSEAFALEDVQALASGLDSADPATRAATARMLALAGDPAALPALLAHMRDSDATAGDRVAEALGTLGTADYAPQVLALLSDPDEAVRARAAETLGLLRYQPAIPELAAMLQNDGVLARQRAADALAAIGSPTALATLTAALADPPMTGNWQVAMQALEHAGPAAAAPLEAALRSNSAVQRSNAAEALGWVRAPGAVPALGLALRDQDPQVRSQAAWALREIGTVPAQQALAESLSSGADQNTRDAAHTALAQAQSQSPERAPVETGPLATFESAITRIPPANWTFFGLVILLAVILLASNPNRTRHHAAQA